MRTQLLCTFTNVETLNQTVDTIQRSYEIVYGKIFILSNTENKEDVMCTYNIEYGNSRSGVAGTISLHRKKHTNTLYTINALNEAIKSHNNGLLDKSFQLDWETYKDCILLTNDNGLKKINTTIRDIIRTNRK